MTDLRPSEKTMTPDPHTFEETLNLAYALLSRVGLLIEQELSRGQDVRLQWGLADLAAIETLESLSEAPSLKPDTAPDPERPSESVETMCDRTAEATRLLLKAAPMAEALEDKSACLETAINAGRLHRALR